MAKAIEFPESDGVETSEDSNVGSLPVKKFPNSNLSCWQLSSEEIAEIQKTGVIWVRNGTFGKLDSPPPGERYQPVLWVTTRKSDAFNT